MNIRLYYGKPCLSYTIAIDPERRDLDFMDTLLYIYTEYKWSFSLDDYRKYTSSQARHYTCISGVAQFYQVGVIKTLLFMLKMVLRLILELFVNLYLKTSVILKVSDKRIKSVTKIIQLNRFPIFFYQSMQFSPILHTYYLLHYYHVDTTIVEIFNPLKENLTLLISLWEKLYRFTRSHISFCNIVFYFKL